MYSIGTETQVFIDGRFVDKSSGVEYVVHPPRKTYEMCITPDGDWEDRIGGYNAVIHDGDGCHLWYTFFGAGRSGVGVGYARSQDGIEWQRPSLSLATEIPGESNVVFGFGASGVPGGLADGSLHIFSDPTAGSDDRFFMLVRLTIKDGLALWASTDGIHWRSKGITVLDDLRSYDDDGRFAGKAFHLDSQNVVFYDDGVGGYVAYIRRNFEQSGQLRTVARGESPSLDSFEYPGDMPVVLTGDPLDPRISDLGGESGRARIDFYTNATAKYQWAADAYYMFPSIYHKYDGWFELFHGEVPLNTGSLDTRFAASRDGISWRRFDRRAFIPLGRNGSFDSAAIYMASGIIPGPEGDLCLYYAGSNILHGYHREDHHRERNDRIIDAAGLGPETTETGISRVVARLDGFVSLRGAYTGGIFTTPALLFEGVELRFNVDTGAVGFLWVEIQDEFYRPIQGFNFSDSVPLHTVNDIDVPVRFSHGKDLKELVGRRVRLCVKITDADLYSFTFAPEGYSRLPY